LATHFMVLVAQLSSTVSEDVHWTQPTDTPPHLPQYVVRPVPPETRLIVWVVTTPSSPTSKTPIFRVDPLFSATWVWESARHFCSSVLGMLVLLGDGNPPSG